MLMPCLIGISSITRTADQMKTNKKYTINFFKKSINDIEGKGMLYIPVINPMIQMSILLV